MIGIRSTKRYLAPAVAADAACVILFCAVGRRSHAEGVTVAGVAQTAWPFLAGAAVGWLVCRGWRNPVAVVRTGVPVWVCTIVVGMLLRKAASGGVAVTFVIVASVVTGVLLLGWRGAAALGRLRARAGRRPTSREHRG